MKLLCPICHTEMLERSNIHICPRNAIGDCCYDAQNLDDDGAATIIEHSQSTDDLRSCSISDAK